MRYKKRYTNKTPKDFDDNIVFWVNGVKVGMQGPFDLIRALIMGAN